jgi:hypothetical protein
MPIGKTQMGIIKRTSKAIASRIQGALHDEIKRKRG